MMRNLDREIERFIEQMQGRKRPAVQFGQRVWRPLVDVFETQDMVVALVELAGVDQEAIDITVEDRLLLIRGRRDGPATHQPSSYHLLEISHGEFERAVPLPANVDPERTSASMHNGLLEVCMPKTQAQRISITVNRVEAQGGR